MFRLWALGVMTIQPLISSACKRNLRLTSTGYLDVVITDNFGNAVCIEIMIEIGGGVEIRDTKFYGILQGEGWS